GACPGVTSISAVGRVLGGRHASGCSSYHPRLVEQGRGDPLALVLFLNIDASDSTGFVVPGDRADGSVAGIVGGACPQVPFFGASLGPRRLRVLRRPSLNRVMRYTTHLLRGRHVEGEL